MVHPCATQRIAAEIRLPSLNWTCDNCGRTFSRIDTANRHVERVHNGNGEVVRFSDYVAGIKVGLYKPNSAQTRSRENEDKIKKTFTNAFYDEIGRQAARSFYTTYLATKQLSAIYESLVAIQKLIDNELITPDLKSALRDSFIQEYDAALQSKIKQLKKDIKSQ